MLDPTCLANPTKIGSEMKIPDAELPLFTKQLSRASAVINMHCRRFLRRGSRIQFFDSFDQTTLRLANGPVWSVLALYYDPFRKFGNDTLVDPSEYAVVGREIHLLSRYGFTDSAFKVIYDGGYDVADYDGSSNPTAPALGEIWVNGGVIKRYESTALVPSGEWVPYITELVPGGLEQAVMEYVSVIRRKTKPGEAGLAGRETQDGTSLIYEPAIPSHVLGILGEYVYYG